jgi:ketosteroid isomerase-like protein
MQTTPRDAYRRMQQDWLSHPAALTGDYLADDVIIEMPFAPSGRQNRFESKRTFLEFANPQRATLPVRFDQCRTIAIHDTTDPDTIIVEYELTATSTGSDHQATAAFIGVLKVQYGKVTRSREYQDTMAILHALG